MRKQLLITILLVLPLTLFAQEEDTGFNFNMGLTLGVQSFEDGEDGSEISYQKLGLIPQFALGKWAVALDLSLHYQTGVDNTLFKLREEDWVSEEGDFQDWLELYFSKFVYLSYGQKGDPLFAQFGSIYQGTLGTGFIMGNYSNTRFLPDQRLLGLALDLDGSLVNFPYLGFESLVGNMAAWDVVGGRLYVRPAGSLEVGLTLAADTNPAYREEYFTAMAADGFYSLNGDGDLSTSIDPVYIYGLDLIQPLVDEELIKLAAFTAVAGQPGVGEKNDQSVGAMIGVGGRALKVIPYVAQIRFLGDNFIPNYFDNSYDLYRAQKYTVVSGTADQIDASIGWLASTGFSIFEDLIVFSFLMDGPFAEVPTTDIEDKLNYESTQYPHLYTSFGIGEGLIPGIFINAYYDKKYITSGEDIFDPVGALMGADINYRTGPAIITLGYIFQYDPATDSYETSARLMTEISL